MCTIASVTTGPHWGDTITVTGTAFDPLGTGSTGAIVTLVQGTVTTTIPPTSIVGWSATQIRFELPTARPAGTTDGAFTLGVQPAGATSPCTASVSITTATTPAVTFGVAPTNPSWGSVIVLQATSGDFGPSGFVTLERGASVVVLSSTWSPSQILATLPFTAPAGDGLYTVRVHRASDSATATVNITATGTTGTASVAATPDPVAPGAQLLLTAIGGDFGILAGSVSFTTGTTTTPASNVPVWTPAQIVVDAPSTAGTYTITVTTRSGATLSGSVVVSAAAGASSFYTPPSLPAFAADPAFALPGAARPAADLATAAQRAAARWRYELLRSQAVHAAEQVVQFDQQVLSLMQMATSKVEAAEQLLNPMLIQAISKLQSDTQSIGDLATSDALKGIISEIASAAATALLLEELITWLLETDPLQFWIGLFGALLEDMCAFDTNASRTRAYIHQSIASGPLTATLALAKDIVKTIDAQIDQFVAPLKAAVEGVIGGASDALKDVFESFDEPLLEKLGVGGAADVANADPLVGVEKALSDTLEDLINQIKDQISAILNAPSQLLEDIIIAFIVAPVLALLAVGLAGGPFGAALFAAIILIAVEELAHLILSWLTGPLLKQIDDAKKKVLEAAAQLQQLLGSEARVVEVNDPGAYLRVLAGEIRELKDLVPEAYLDAVAELLSVAREAVMDDAVRLALSAERALGVENATAFDDIAYKYASGLPTAPQLPGGSDATLFAGASLLRDLGRLEQQRTALLDGKDVQVARRLSLLDMLGGDRTKLLDFVRDGRLLVHLTERALLDRQSPGLYRALIEEVRASGLFDTSAGPLPAAINVPLMMTHLGPSRTRIKRNGNPNAPPIAVPPVFGSATGFTNVVYGILHVRPTPYPGGTGPAPVPEPPPLGPRRRRGGGRR